ncbi:MAG: hypothetical protein DIU70_009470 [Bacillota bacterium]
MAQEKSQPIHPPLTYGGLLRLFLPLSLSDMILVVSGPVISAVLSRLPEAAVQIAAYGVAETLAILLESPIIMILQAATAAAADPPAYRALGRLMWLWNGALTLLYALLAFTPAYFWITEAALGLPPEVAAAARPAFGVMLLWPAAIGYRRYLQGMLIYHGQSRQVLQGGIVRLLSLLTVLGAATAPAFLAPGSRLQVPGAVAAGLALQASVIGEAAAIAWFARRLQRELAAASGGEAPGRGESPGLAGSPGRGEPPVRTGVPPRGQVPDRLGPLFWWYLPLAGTQVLVWVSRPLLTGGIARADLAAASLTAWPAVWTTVSLLANGTRMVQQMTISLVRDRESDRMLRRFSVGVGLSFSLLLGLLGFTPLGDGYLARVLALPAEAARVARPVLNLAALYPLEVALQNWLQGLLVQTGRTGRVNLAALVGGGATLALVYAGAWLTHIPGAPLAGAATVLGMAVELGALWAFSRPARARFGG